MVTLMKLKSFKNFDFFWRLQRYLNLEAETGLVSEDSQVRGNAGATWRKKLQQWQLPQLNVLPLSTLLAGNSGARPQEGISQDAIEKGKEGVRGG